MYVGILICILRTKIVYHVYLSLFNVDVGTLLQQQTRQDTRAAFIIIISLRTYLTRTFLANELSKKKTV